MSSKKSTSNNSSPPTKEDLREALKTLNTRDNFLPLRRCTDLIKGREYLVERLDRKTVTHGGKRAVVICREGDTNFITFLSPSYNEAHKYNSLDILLKKSKPYNLYMVLEDIVEEKDMIIPIYNFLLKNPITKERVVVPCNYSPSSEAVQQRNERDKSGSKEAEDIAGTLEGVDDDETNSDNEKMESENDAGGESEENESVEEDEDDEDDEVVEIPIKKMKLASPKTPPKKAPVVEKKIKNVAKNSLFGQKTSLHKKKK